MRIGDALLKSLTKATKKYSKIRKAEERLPTLRYHRHERLRSSRVTIKDAAWRAMEAAYLKASANGTLPAHARQIMYAARGNILAHTGRTSLDDQYFCQVLLPDYLMEFPDQTAGWDVVFDARGQFEEPHTKCTVALGTLAVRKHLSSIANHTFLAPTLTVGGEVEFPTCGPRHRYGAILFIEKGGFLPLFEAVQLAERYDLAIMSSKGVSSTAARRLVDDICSRGNVPLLVLHDFDKVGFSILATLRYDTRRYEFDNQINVIDLGLRLADVHAHDLPAEHIGYGNSDPSDNLRCNGATEEEIAFLYDGDGEGQRVELNAFTSDQLVAWIEGKLQGHGVRKVVPTGDDLEEAYRRAITVAALEAEVGAIEEKALEKATTVEIPTGLEATIRENLEQNRMRPWDEVLAEIAREYVDDEDEDESA